MLSNTNMLNFQTTYVETGNRWRVSHQKWSAPPVMSFTGLQNTTRMISSSIVGFKRHKNILKRFKRHRRKVCCKHQGASAMHRRIQIFSKRHQRRNQNRQSPSEPKAEPFLYHVLSSTPRKRIASSNTRNKTSSNAMTMGSHTCCSTGKPRGVPLERTDPCVAHVCGCHTETTYRSFSGGKQGATFTCLMSF